MVDIELKSSRSEEGTDLITTVKSYAMSHKRGGDFIWSSSMQKDYTAEVKRKNITSVSE